MSAALPPSAYDAKPPGYFEAIRTDIAPLLPDNARRVLELGCGNGATMSWLRSIRQVDYAVGIELFPESAETAKANFDMVLICSVENAILPQDSAPFNLIMALDVLEHTADPSAIVQKYAQLLALGGAIVVSLPNIGTVLWRSPYF